MAKSKGVVLEKYSAMSFLAGTPTVAGRDTVDTILKLWSHWGPQNGSLGLSLALPVGREIELELRISVGRSTGSK